MTSPARSSCLGWVKFKTSIFILYSFRVISLLVCVVVLVLRTLQSLVTCWSGTPAVHCSDLEGSVQLVTRTRRPKQNTQTLDVDGTWSVTEKDEKGCSGSRARRHGQYSEEVRCSLSRQKEYCWKGYRAGFVGTQRDFDGETWGKETTWKNPGMAVKVPTSSRDFSPRQWVKTSFWVYLASYWVVCIER